MTRIAGALTLALGFALMTTVALAADIEVNADCSLAAAITAANTDETSAGCPAGGGADIITLSGDITLEAALPDISSEIRIEGAGYAISGAEQFRIFLVAESGALTLHEATLSDGVAQPVAVTFAVGAEPSSRERGGAVFNLGSLHVISSQFSNNHAAYYGGALWNHWESGGLIVEDSVFTDNSAGRSGGAIDNLGSAQVSGSQFFGNEAESGAAVFVLDDGDIEISDSQFEGNGGGGQCAARWSTAASRQSAPAFSLTIPPGSLVAQSPITASWRSSTASSASMSSARMAARCTTKGALDILDGQFADNSASIGGAIANYGSVQIASSEFVGNAASVTGGRADDL